MVYILFYRVDNEDNVEYFIKSLIIVFVLLLFILGLLIFLVWYLKKKIYYFRGSKYGVKGNIKF